MLKEYVIRFGGETLTDLTLYWLNNGGFSRLYLSSQSRQKICSSNPLETAHPAPEWVAPLCYIYTNGWREFC